MLSQKVQDALNERIKLEMFAANTYLSMAAYCESINLPGFAHWMRSQFQEEIGHALRLYEYISDRDGRVIVPGVDQPAVEFSGPSDVFQKALEHERRVTASYGELYDLVMQEKDYTTLQIVNWFINEQIEEEKTVLQVLEQVKMAEKDSAALLMLDRELARRQAGAQPL